ncbi:MAG: alpha-L-fucosidase 2 [Pseudonocardiales bacterium]|nr:alpha-L-fucosidase 2 [Pseudonocardiales bacterium]
MSGLKVRGNVTVDTQWAGGAPTRITLRPGQSGALKIGSDLFTRQFRLVDTRSGASVPYQRDGRIITFQATGSRQYVVSGG